MSDIALEDYPILPEITDHARAIYERGQAVGRNPHAFSKVGDCITATGHFLYPFGWGRYNLREYAYYESVINFFRGATARESNSFSNGSLAAKSGWTTFNVLDPASAEPGTCQIGSNDLPVNSVGTYEANLRQIVQITIDMGVIPVLSTLPYRQYWEAKTDQFNQVIINTARAYDIPLWDYASAMKSLPNQGLEDGLHPSWVGDEYSNYDPSGDFSAENLTNGFPLRNLMALQVLDAIWRQVIAPNANSAVPVIGTNTDGLSGSYNAAASAPQPPTDGTCPGAPPFRLQVGQNGRVTPGTPNRLRAEGTSTSAIIGEIPGGATFSVIGGPSCSGGMTYWQVNYNGQIGWTAEGQGSSYWVEPIQ